jgi:CRISPR/Cas system-associated protein Cas5 (RAMP superfamily)
MRNESFEKYVSNLKREYNSIWKPIKIRRKTNTTSPLISKYSTPPGPWTKCDQENVELFAEHLSEVFSPHNNEQDQEVEQELATPIH